VLGIPRVLQGEISKIMVRGKVPQGNFHSSDSTTWRDHLEILASA
jgi:hypothetical protein